MREVRVSNAFFDDVDELFPSTRGADGTPSADDFIRFALPSLIAEIGERFDGVADMPDGPGVRAFVLPGVLVPFVAIYAGELSSGIVYLLGMEIDNDSP
ncbi:MAG: hypothetical protein ACRBK7_30420 [Acidimicrobiales bacterium]